MNWNRNKRDVWHAIGARLIRSIVCAFHLCSCRHWSRIKALQMIVFDYQTVSSAVKDSNRFCIVLLGESWMMTTARPGTCCSDFDFCCRRRRKWWRRTAVCQVVSTVLYYYAHCLIRNVLIFSHPLAQLFFFFCFCFLLSSCDSFAHTSVLLTRTWCPSADRWCRLLSQLLFVLMSYFYYSSVRKWKTRETGSVRARKRKSEKRKGRDKSQQCTPLRERENGQDLLLPRSRDASVIQQKGNVYIEYTTATLSTLLPAVSAKSYRKEINNRKKKKKNRCGHNVVEDGIIIMASPSSWTTSESEGVIFCPVIQWPNCIIIFQHFTWTCGCHQMEILLPHFFIINITTTTTTTKVQKSWDLGW